MLETEVPSLKVVFRFQLLGFYHSIIALKGFVVVNNMLSVKLINPSFCLEINLLLYDLCGKLRKWEAANQS